MASKNLSKLASELTVKVRDIKLNELSALQTSNNQKILFELQKNAGELANSISSGVDKNEMLEKHDLLVQSIDTAGLTGLISSDELLEYYNLLDDLWAAIEKEK